MIDRSRSIAVLVLAVLAVPVCTDRPRAHESSDTYLRNVVNELKLMSGNKPTMDSVGAESIVHDRRNAPAPLPQELEVPEELYPGDASPLSSAPLVYAPLNANSLDKQVRRPPPPPPALLQPHVEEVVPPPPPPPPPVLGFTPTELAAMYTRAIEQGSPVKYGAFVNTLNHPLPNVYDGGQLEIPEPVVQSHHPGDGQYAYYFYPLHTFHRELANQHGYRIAPNFHHAPLPAKSSKKEMNAMNPILVGISSFMGMALFFLFSMFFYPRFMHLMHFPFFASSRTYFQNELTHLTAFVTEAIEYYNKAVRKKSKRS